MVFHSRKYTNLRLTLDPKGTTVMGGRVVMQGLAGKFPLGLTVEFQNGLYETKDEAIIQAMKDHVSFGLGFFAEDEPVELKPAQVRALNEKKEVAQKVADTNQEGSKKKN